MAHTKAAGSTKLGRDSKGQRLGVKLFGGQVAKTGDLIVRQRGTSYVPGINTFKSKDDTIHASVDGSVNYKRKKKSNFNGTTRTVVEVSVSV